MDNNTSEKASIPADKANTHVHIIKAADSYSNPVSARVEKSDTQTYLSGAESSSSAEWISPSINQLGLKNLVEQSSILPQCINAYRSNIAGFGLGIKYKEDIEETPEMVEEYDKAHEVINLLSLEQDTKEVFESLIRTRETYGIGYLECVRNIEGNVVEIECIKDVPTVRKSRLQKNHIEITHLYEGNSIKRNKRFRKYKQEVSGQTVYFKEFGDPRVMDNRTGEYISDGDSLPPIEYQANEILEFTVGDGHYGQVRWLGQVLGVDGSRMAEELNNNYFVNGRHTPMLISVSGGTLSDDSWTKLQEYMNGIKGKAGQHAFIVIEAESKESRAGFEQENPIKVEVKDLAAVLQKDELFQTYLDNNRRRVQSSFQLPDIYVAYTTDYNRATAQAAMEITEQQVFQPERQNLAWRINNKLLNSYCFRFIEVYFEAPDLSNPDDIKNLLTVAGLYGGLSMNKAKEVAYKALGDKAEDYDAEWGNLPLPLFKQGLTPQGLTLPSLPEFTLNGSKTDPEVKTDLAEEIQKAIKKELSSQTADDAVISVMKEVKKLLMDMSDGDKPEDGSNV